jgi:hypothetical protein
MVPLLIAQPANAVNHQPISAAGWLFMIVSVGFVTVLAAWCYRKVLALPPEEREEVHDLHSA